MRIRLSVAGTLLVFVALLCGAQNPTGSSEETRQLLALETAWNQAEMKGDTRGLEILLGDDFVYTDSDGSLRNREQWLANVRQAADEFDQNRQ